MKTNSSKSSGRKISANKLQIIKKRKSVIYRNQENNNNHCNHECDVVKKSIYFEEDSSFSNKSNYTMEDFSLEKTEITSNLKNYNDHITSQYGAMRNLYEKEMKKTNSYLRFEDNDFNSKRQKFQ